MAAQYDLPSDFNYHRRLTALRRERVVIAIGTFSRIDPARPSSLRRPPDGDRLLVALNLSDAQMAIRVPAAWKKRHTPILASYADTSRRALRPWEARVLAARKD